MINIGCQILQVRTSKYEFWFFYFADILIQCCTGMQSKEVIGINLLLTTLQ